MTLRVLTGKANTGRTGTVFEMLRERVVDHSEVVVVLPSWPDVGRMRTEVAHFAPVGLRVETFGRLVRTLWEQCGDGRELASRSRRELALVSIARSMGSSRAMARLGSQCIDVITSQVGEGWRQHRPEDTGLGVELAHLIASYAVMLSDGGFVESNEAAHILAALPEVPRGLYVFHDFGDFTPAQLALIRGLSAGRDVVVSVTHEEGFAPTRAMALTLESLEPYEHLKTTERPFGTHAALVRFTDDLFTERDPQPEIDAVRFAFADGHIAQAELVADEVERALEEEAAASAERVAIVARSMGRQAHGFAAALEHRGIPFDIDAEVALRRTGLGGAYLSALEFTERASRPSLLALMRSPYSGVTPAHAHQLEALVRREGLETKGAIERAALTQCEDSRELIEALRAARADGGALSIGDLAALARLLYRNGSRSHAAREGQMQEDAAAYRTIVSALMELDRLSAHDLGPGDLREALVGAGVALGEVERPGRVQILDAMRARSRRFDTVIIAGLNDGEFPLEADETVMPGGAVDAVMRRFGARGAIRRGPEFEQMLFYEVASRARNRLVLVARTGDGEGEALKPSSLLEAAADRFRCHTEDRRWPTHRFAAATRAPASDATAPREQLRAAASCGEGGDARGRAAQARARLSRGGQEALAGLDASGPLSPSQIEAYLNCPYRWFLERKVRPLELESRADARNQGLFAHEILRLVYAELMNADMLPLRPRHVAAALEILTRVSVEHAQTTGPAPTLDERVSRQRALAWVRRMLEREAYLEHTYRPTSLEWGFGLDDEPVCLGSIELRGRVDRIDQDEFGRAVVIDYKRSPRDSQAAAKMISEGRIQIPLYMAAVEERLKLKVVGGVYRGLSAAAERGVMAQDAGWEGPLKSTDRLDEGALAGLRTEALTLAHEAAEGMRSGRIPALPRHKSSCVGCLVRQTCGRAL